MSTPTFAALLAAPPPLDALREFWLVLTAETADALLAKQSALAEPRHRVSPLAGPASDPRFALCADLISEIAPGGLYAPLFATLDPAAFETVEVVSAEQLRAAGWFASADLTA